MFRLFLLIILSIWSSVAQATQICDEFPGWDDVFFEGEVTGKNSFSKPFGDKTFTLTPTPYGWQIQVLNSANIDLATITPPIRLVDTNPRFISGWHFNNSKQGVFYALQKMREFSFGSMENPSNFGHGELLIQDMRMTDLATGQKARINHLKFSTCIHWPSAIIAPVSLAQTADQDVPAHMAIYMQQCGLDPKLYKLSDRMTKGVEGGQEPFLRPDFNGDGTADVAIPITRLSDNTSGLAICLAAQNKLLIIGYNGRIGKHFDPAYFDSADFWAVQYERQFGQGAEETPPPTASGDAILLAKSESSSVLLYLDENKNINSYWQGD